MVNHSFWTKYNVEQNSTKKRKREGEGEREGEREREKKQSPEYFWYPIYTSHLRFLRLTWEDPQRTISSACI
jgi:hypothetical protein